MIRNNSNNSIKHSTDSRAEKLSSDRWILEMGEARVLANNFKDKAWLEAALKVSARYYGESSKERIKKYMRQIWKEELLK